MNNAVWQWDSQRVRLALLLAVLLLLAGYWLGTSHRRALANELNHIHFHLVQADRHPEAAVALRRFLQQPKLPHDLAECARLQLAESYLAIGDHPDLSHDRAAVWYRRAYLAQPQALKQRHWRGLLITGGLPTGRLAHQPAVEDPRSANAS